ncbi:MAG: fasciclin domain-containing protein [Clostridia bacterium]|nr:fasciclin domain-containing protein [Deltaproteobacteria bacterium]
MAQKDLIETAQSAGAFGTLIDLVAAAEMTETLKGPGPFTVFAPTDQAFTKFSAEQIAALKKNKEQLRAVLSYHVMSGKVTARDVAGMNSATTLAGPAVDIKQVNGALQINDATVVQPDVAASNGIIHVIDAVLTPSSEP